MADFRKVLFAFAAVALLAGLTVPAYAQSTCTANAGVNTLVRSEGYNDLVGDITLSCTGGSPTPVNTLVPQVDILITMNTTITSRVTATISGGLGVSMTEALLLMDEPNGARWNNVGGHPIYNCGRNGEDSSTSGPGVCAIYASSSPDLTYDGDPSHAGVPLCAAAGPNNNPPAVPPTYPYGCGRPNVFQGRQAAVLTGSTANTVQFLGIPYDPPCIPGTCGFTTRILRFVNLRVDGTRFGVASPFTTVPVIATISISNNSSISLQNTSVQVGQVQQGLSTSVRSATFLQCVSTKDVSGNSSTFPLFGGTSSPAGGMRIRVLENFPTAFKVKNVTQILNNGTLAGTNYTYNGTTNYPLLDIDQNVPGAVYGTETGFYFPLTGSSAAPANPPAGFGPPVTGAIGSRLTHASTGIAKAGFANQGTRIAVSTDPAPAGVTVYFPLTVNLRNQSTGVVTGILQLVTTDANGANLTFGFSAVTQAVNPLPNTGNNLTFANPGGSAAVGQAGGAANNFAVYEVLFSDPNSQEYADIYPSLLYTSNLSTNSPTPGAVNATVGFAPFYAASTGANLPSATLPEPRFVPGGASSLLYTILRCQCDLLFPWVVGDGSIGYLTSIVVDNTSADPFGTTGASGAVTFNYYGTKGISLDPSQTGTFTAQTSTASVPPGSYIVTIVTNAASGNTAANGLKALSSAFAGYVISQANFQNCHGVASISGGGLATQTYIGLQMDTPTGSRTGQASEVLAH